ncbi:MAG: hypothetical protein A3H35_01185 [Betaproteobacteria bacterium RIFCSPLOWO2_02_FULL_62_17]|nr:MAG: hypothetical protein A3H35_01185 [Betaproteobacteria bacterium RIFCSPLOWO2_02_FULL_62_17]
MHARFYVGKHLGENLVLHQRGLADPFDVLGAFHRLDEIECLGELRMIDAAQLPQQPAGEAVVHHRCADQRYRLAARLPDFLRDEIGVIVGGIADCRKHRRGEPASDAVVGTVYRVEIRLAAKIAMVHDGHRPAGRKNHRLRIGSQRRNTGKPAEVSAQPGEVIRALDDQRLDSCLAHRFAHARPAALQFGVGNGIADPFVCLRHRLPPGWAAMLHEPGTIGTAVPLRRMRAIQ